jgi:hypothetical protein
MTKHLPSLNSYLRSPRALSLNKNKNRYYYQLTLISGRGTLRIGVTPPIFASAPIASGGSMY